MAVTNKPMATGARLVVTKEVDGKTSSVSRTYGNVKPAAQDEAIYTVLDAIAGLQVNPVKEIIRVDNAELIETV